MTTTTTKPVQTAVASAWDENRLAAAAQHMYAAETFLHTARQSGVNEWISLAYQHLHDAITEHDTCLHGAVADPADATPTQEILMNQTSDHRADIHADVQADIHEIHASFPQVPARIVTAVFLAYLPLTRTALEAVQATRERLSDAVAA
jgi:hypothetical protein